MTGSDLTREMCEDESLHNEAHVLLHSVDCDLDSRLNSALGQLSLMYCRCDLD